jgi:hypothetical protein
LFFPSEIDLLGNSLYFNEDCALLGSSSETAKITSALGTGISLITSVGSLVIQNISLEVTPLIVLDTPNIFNLDGISEPMAALDWFAVNCVGGEIGTIKNYANAVFLSCAFIGETQGFVFDGTFDSIVFDGCIFRNGLGGTCIKFLDTAIINRRIRIENTPFNVPLGVVGIDLSVLATVNTEGYIAKYVNFSGAGTYLLGVQPNDNKSLFIECRGVENSASISELYMINNAVATVIADLVTFVKALGTTLSGLYIQRFTNTNNRATYSGAITKYFNVNAVLSLSSGNNHLIAVRIAKNGTTIASSETQVTTSGSGRSENLKSQTIVSLSNGDFIEVFVNNQTSVQNITVTELNLILTPLN